MHRSSSDKSGRLSVDEFLAQPVMTAEQRKVQAYKKRIAELDAAMTVMRNASTESIFRMLSMSVYGDGNGNR